MGGLDKRVGVSTPEDDFVVKFRKNLEGSRSAFSPWKEKAKKYYRTYAGDPWSDADRAKMQKEDRPPVTYNYALSVINAVLGKEMSERKEIKFEGVGKHDLRDQKVAEWQTNLVRTWWAQCDGHRHESQSLLDQLITGYGWGHVFLDLSRFPFKVKLEHVDPWEMLPDPKAKDDNLTDARWLIRERRWGVDEVKAVWPEKSESLVASLSTSGHSSVYPKVAVAGYTTNSIVAPDEEEITVWEYQFRKKERWVAFVDPDTDERLELPQDEFDQVQQQAEEAGMQVPEWEAFMRDVFYRCYLGGSEQSDTVVLQEPERMHTDLFTYTCITGFREKIIGERTEFFGLMHLIYEPQMWSSKVLSTIIEVMARSNKNGILYEQGSIVDPIKFKEEFSKPGGMMMVEEGALRDKRLEFLKPPSYPQGLDMIIHQAVKGIHDISGVSEIVMGTSKQERSNVLVTNYQDKSYTLLTPLIDPLSGFRIRIGRLLAAYIQKYVPEEDINRSIEDEGVKDLTVRPMVDPQTGQPMMDPETGKPGMEQIATPGQLLKQVNLMDYDVVVDLSFATTSEKQSLWQLFAQHGVLQMLTEAGVPTHKLFPFIFRMLPVPAEMARELGDEMEKELGQQNAMQTADGMIEIFQGMDPETMNQVAQQVMQIMQQMQQQQQQQQPQQQQPQQPQQ